MKTVGTILMVIGLIALVITGIDYIEETKSIKLLGERFTFSKGNITFVIVSALVFISGLLVRNNAK